MTDQKQWIQAFDNPMLEKILNSWFESGYTREEKLPILFEEHQLCRLASKIFKRGTKLLETESNTFAELDAPSNILSQKVQILKASDLQTFLQKLQKVHSVFFLIDSNFYKHHFQFVNETGIQDSFILTPSEATKNLTTVSTILKSIPEKVSSIVVLGGGICCDIGGFISGLLQLPIHYVATTLLSTVDAGIGGKTGVNHHKYGKNQLGLFVNIDSYFVVPEFLNSLTDMEWLCGLGECLKHSYLWGTLQKDSQIIGKLSKDRNSTEEDLTDFINLNVLRKQSLVALDPKEKHVRIFLNFGHTVAHVLESLGDLNVIAPKIPHGLAVCFGIKFLVESLMVKNDSVGLTLKICNELIFLSQIRTPFEVLASSEVLEAQIKSLLIADKKNSRLPANGCMVAAQAQDTAINSVTFVLPTYGVCDAILKMANDDESLSCFDNNNENLKTHNIDASKDTKFKKFVTEFTDKIPVDTVTKHLYSFFNMIHSNLSMSAHE